MTSAPLHPDGGRPDEPLPDVHIYPEGTFRTMPSVAHERARTRTFALLQSVAAPADLVAGELAVLWDPRDLRAHLVPDIMKAR